MSEEKIEIENAVIESARFDIERGCLSAWLSLKYGACGQGFGGYLLYAPSGWALHGADFTGHFIWRCLQVADVDDWSKIPGRTVRARHTFSNVIAIGHIIKDDWFAPSEEFAALKVKDQKR